MRIDPNELGLVRACLANDDDFLSAFRSWEHVSDLDVLNYGAVRLIPYLSRRLDLHQISTPLKAKLDGIYRYFWAKRRVQEAAMAELLPAFFVGTQAVALKGLALEKLAYRQGELRPLDDFDALVSRNDYLRLSSNYKQFGFHYGGTLPEESSNHISHAKTLKAKNMELDLHWTPFPTSMDPSYESRMIDRASGTGSELAGLLVQSPTDCLLQTVIHGNRENIVSPVRWYLDAFLLIERNDIDWGLLWDEAGKLGLAGQLDRGAQQLNAISGRELIKKQIAPETPTLLPYHMRVSIARDNSRHIWQKRLLRLIGSDVSIVARARALDGLPSGALTSYLSGLRDLLSAIQKVLATNFLRSEISNSWAIKRDADPK